VVPVQSYAYKVLDDDNFAGTAFIATDDEKAQIIARREILLRYKDEADVEVVFM
jgi:hypothetical protein